MGIYRRLSCDFERASRGFFPTPPCLSPYSPLHPPPTSPLPYYTSLPMPHLLPWFVMVALCNMDSIIFLPCSSFLLCSSSFLLQIGCLPYFHTWCDHSANLRCRSETCFTQLAVNTAGRKKIAIGAPSNNFVGLYLRN